MGRNCPTHRQKHNRISSTVEESSTIASVSLTSKRTGTRRSLSHHPPALCISWWHHRVLPPAKSVAEEGLWCDWCTSLQPALRPGLVVILFPCIKVSPLHFGRLHNWVYLQLFPLEIHICLCACGLCFRTSWQPFLWSPVLSLRP